MYMQVSTAFNCRTLS